MKKFYIIYPRGDKTKLSIIDLTYQDELHDYVVASRQEFFDLPDAVEYAKTLARKHNLLLEVDDREMQQELNYLD